MIEYDNLTLDEAQDDQGLALLELPRGWANQTIIDGKVVPPLSAVFLLKRPAKRLRSAPQPTRGQDRILCVASEEGSAYHPELRARVGEERLTIFRRHDQEARDVAADNRPVIGSRYRRRDCWYESVFGAVSCTARS